MFICDKDIEPLYSIVTVYTQFGYAMVDLEKYKDELQHPKSGARVPR